MTQAKRARLYHILLLLALLGLGGYLRCVVGLNWDQGQLLHPDERFLTMVGEKISLPESFSQYFDASRNPLSPYNNGYDYYVYGTFPLYLTKIVSIFVGMSDYGHINLVGRVLGGLADLLAILGVYLIGSTLYSRASGLLAATFLTLSVQNIQLSHFFGMENFVAAALTFSALYLIYSAQAFNKGNLLKARLWLVVAGLVFGVAMASKVSAVFFLLPVFACSVGLVCISSSRQQQLRSVAPELAIGATTLFCLLGLIVFRLLQPSAFEGNSFVSLAPKFLENMAKIKEITDGGEWPPNLQWADRAPILYSLRNMLRWEMGYGFFIAAIGGLLIASAELVQRRKWAHAFPVAWTLLFFIYQSTRFVKYGRYLSIIYPFLAVLAGYFVVEVIWKRCGVWRWVLAPSLLGLALVWCLAFVSIYDHDNTRIRASRWMYSNIPAGSTIGNEDWDDNLPLRIDGKDAFGGIFKNVTFNPYEPDNQDKREKLVIFLEQSDYVVLSSDRGYRAVPRLRANFPFTSFYYHALMQGRLGFEKVLAAKQPPYIAGLTLDDACAVESFSVYDHPKVFIFKKTPTFSAQRIKDVLNDFPDGTAEKLIAVQAQDEAECS